jgi:murein DD-endopeptidase MepM/ murein hydrolase activator NlpD
MFAMMEQLLTKQMELLQAGKLTPTTPSTETSTPTNNLDTVQSSGVSNMIAASSGQKQAKELKQPAVLLANQARAQALAQSVAQKESSTSTPSTATPIEISPVNATPSSGHAAPYGEPAHGPLTQGFTSSHNGLDIGVVVGTPIHSSMDGKVIYAGWSPIGYGNLVIVQNGDYQTYYAHLSKIPVTNGQTVQAGSVIGLSGSTGNSTGPHLHYEIRYKGKNLDPTSLTLNKAI